MREINHIVFDIGRVLIHYDPEIPYRRIIPDAEERRWFLTNICSSDWNLEQDRGRSWADAEDLLIADHPEHEEQIRAFRKHWHEMVSHAYEDTVEVLDQILEAGHDVTMLTNFSGETFPQACEMYPFLKTSRGVTVSGDVKLIKPDPAIYDLHTKSFGLDPIKTLFIDDSAANVAGARCYGWQSVQFTGADALRAELKQSGIEF